MKAGRSRRHLENLSDTSAFTLIELVISASLMTLILVSAYLCLNAGLSSQKLIESRAEIVQSARVAMALISADLRCACPLSPEFPFLGMRRKVGEVEADNLDFATHNYTPHRPHEGDFCEVSFFLDKDLQSGQFCLWRRRNPTLAPDPLSGGRREEIARGLLGLRFEYSDGYEWYEEWGEAKDSRQELHSWLAPVNLAGMPEAVRITLWFGPHSPSPSEAPPKPDTTEPPMVFQTVARLNLAALSQRLPATASSTNPPAAGPGNEPAGTRN